jgi:D-alanyl-D-alanine carboxypeptidase
MNAKARKLGMRDTTYRNANGSYNDSRHRSSAYDLARLARYAMKNARFRDLARRQRAVVRWGKGRRTTVRSNNLLLHHDWADGVKCGFTKAAGICLVGSGTPGLRPFITATLGARSRDQDARDHVALYEWASGLYESRTIVAAGDVVREVSLPSGEVVQVVAKTTLTAVVRGAAPVRPTVKLTSDLGSRPADGTVVGSVVYRADGVQLGTVKLVVAPPPEPPQSEPEAASVAAASATAATPAASAAPAGQ